MDLQAMLRCRAGWAQAAGPSHDVVLASRVRLARNLASACFPGKARPTALRGVRERVFAAAKRTYLKDAGYLELDALGGMDRAFLAERHLISPALAAAPGMGGVVADARECLNVMVNEEDHLRIFALSPGLDLAEAARQADGLDTDLAGELEFAYRRDWGYLTACPTNLGTGMRASVLVHLAGLVLGGYINKLLESLPRAGLIARGLYGEGSKVMGDFFQVSNAAGLGRTEGELVSAVEKAVQTLVRRETEARQRLAAGPGRSRFEDAVYRSIATLTAARLLSFEEASQHLSSLRLALSLGWEAPGDLGTVNELTLLTQPAHLSMLAGKPLSVEDQALLRASLVRRRLAGKKDA